MLELGTVEGAAAYEACQGFINDTLKAPATAVYAPLNEKGVTVRFVGDAAYVVSHVDSENEFGALIRSKLLCTMKRVDGEWKNPDPALTLIMDNDA